MNIKSITIPFLHNILLIISCILLIKDIFSIVNLDVFLYLILMPLNGINRAIYLNYYLNNDINYYKNTLDKFWIKLILTFSISFIIIIYPILFIVRNINLFTAVLYLVFMIAIIFEILNLAIEIERFHNTNKYYRYLDKNKLQEIINLNYIEILLEEIDINSNNECSICSENMNKYIELKCKHKFHKSCILEWIKINPICPYCRSIDVV